MKLPKTEILWLVLGLCIGTIIMQRCNGNQVKDTYKERLADKDSLLSAERRNTALVRGFLDSAIADNNKEDKSLQEKEQKIITKYVQVPKYIHSLTNDELRREIADY